MARLKKPKPTTLDKVVVTRIPEGAEIRYLDGKTSSVHFKIGPKAESMSDAEVIESFNGFLKMQREMAKRNKRPAIEIPRGRPQIRYFAPGGQWVPRGQVLRCLIDDGPGGEVTVTIDKKELSMREFSTILATYAGWGMRITFVPEDEIHKMPTVEVKDVED